MPTSLARTPSKLTQPRSASNNATLSRVCALSRHPTALATALGHLATLRLPAYVRKLAEALLFLCDREGLYWGKVTKELRALTGLSPNRIRVAARILRGVRSSPAAPWEPGLIDWKWLKMGRRYPRRRSYAEPASFAHGESAGHGGRIWVIQWRKWGVNWDARDIGTADARVIHMDQSRVIHMDQSSDPLDSSSLINDPAVPRTHDLESGVELSRDSEASETPSAAEGEPAFAQIRRPAGGGREPEPQTGGGPGELGGQGGPVTPEAIAAFAESLRRGTLPPARR